MRRDERHYDATEGADELDAIESQWSRIWDEIGYSEERVNAIARREEFKLMWPYLQRLPKECRLLDGGCGLGEYAVWLTRHGYATVGLDISRTTIDLLRKTHPEVEFDVADIRETGLPAASFDGYFSWGTFEHFEEGLGPVVAEAFRVLKPGGLLFVSTPFDNLRHALHGTLRDPWRLSPQPEPRRFYQWRLTRGELAVALARGGFEVEAIHVINKRQGAQRWLQHAFGVDTGSMVWRGVAAALAAAAPGVLIGHMILAVARRPDRG